MGVEETIGEADEPRRYALTVADFLCLDEAGAFANSGAVELIDGEIFQLSPVYSRHALVQSEISFQLRQRIDSSGLSLAVLAPVSVLAGEHSLPQPDVVVAPRPSGNAPVDSAAVLIAIEVSSSTLRHDLVKKAKLYADSGIPEYCVVDVEARQLHQLTEPASNGYAARDVVPFGARVVLKKVPEIALDTSAFG